MIRLYGGNVNSIHTCVTCGMRRWLNSNSNITIVNKGPTDQHENYTVKSKDYSASVYEELLDK